MPLDPPLYRLGQYVPRDIRARVAFQVTSQSALQQQEQNAISATPANFSLNEPLVAEIVAALRSMPGRLATTSRPAKIDPTVRKQFGLHDEATPAAWRLYADNEGQRRLEKQTERLRSDLASICLVKPTDAKFQREQRTARDVVLTHDGTSDIRSLSEIISTDERPRLAGRLSGVLGHFDQGLRASINTYLSSALGAGKELYRYNAVATQEEIEKRLKHIHENPPCDQYAAGQILVYHGQAGQANDRSGGLDAAEMELLRNEHKAYLAFQRQSRPWRQFGNYTGRITILLLMTTLLCLYTYRYQQRIVRNPWRGLALGAILLMMIALSKAAVFALQLNVYSAMFAVMCAAILLTIAYGRRFAMAIGAMLSLMIVIQLRQDLDMLLVLLVGIAVGVFQLQEIRTRSKILKVSVVTATIALATISSLALTNGKPWQLVVLDGTWAAGAILAAGMFTQVILPLVERMFGIATSMTLLEWCDASKALLRRLATDAPGTWNHSLQLGSMCETAAEAIGARGLLARVGAYYHDIGKVNKPDYFVENQAGAPSKHEKLSPAMSLLIIIGHVKDGLEMAREYGLPQVLHQFIVTHHGTTLVQYFYHAATEQRKGESEKAPNEVEFRYPGPKPKSRETGILMLADAAESSVRSLSEPTPGQIEGQVHTMVNRRLMDGQLDECEMTLREVHQVETSLVKSLCGIYHARISYPTPSASQQKVTNDK